MLNPTRIGSSERLGWIAYEQSGRRNLFSNSQISQMVLRLIYRAQCLRPFLLYRRVFNDRSLRNISTNLLYIPRSVDSSGLSPAAIGFFSGDTSKPRQSCVHYDVIYDARHDPPTHAPSISLLVLDDLSDSAKAALKSLTWFPATMSQEDTTKAIEGLRALKKVEDLSHEANHEPPPPMTEEERKKYEKWKGDEVEDEATELRTLASLKLCEDFDPSFSDDSIMSPNDPDAHRLHAKSLDLWDRVDMKNCNHIAEELDHELKFYNQHETPVAWVRAYLAECTHRTHARLYDLEEIQIEPIEGVIISNHFDTTPLSGEYYMLRELHC